MARSNRKFSVVADSTDLHGLEDRAVMASVSDMLRQARMRAGYSLPDVAKLLRIRLVYLEAIEESRFDDLPGSVYAMGFIRTYADMLELDVEEAVRRFREEMSGTSVSRPKELVFPAPSRQTGIPGGALLALGLVLTVSIYGGWYYLSSTNRTLADLVPPLPERFAALIQSDPAPLVDATVPSPSAAEPVVPAEAPAASPAPSIPAATPEPVAPSSLAEAAPDEADVPAVVEPEEPVTADTATTPDPAPQPAEAPRDLAIAATRTPDQAAASTAPPPPPPEAVSGGAVPGDVDGRVVLRATAMSWVQVRDNRGSLVMTRVLEPGDIYQVPDTEGLRLVSGNAGGVEITVDGQPVAPIGESGEVVRNVSLDPDDLLAGVTPD
ncbi:MAG: RodZ domain-containing protein [Inquilinaceae bacterium]